MTLPDIEPAFTEQAIPVIFSCDNNYAIFVGVAIQNIIDLSSPKRHYDLIILHCDISETLQHSIQQLANGNVHISIRFFNIKEYTAQFNIESINIAKRFTVEVFYPLFVPELFGKYEKVLYIDPDIVLREDIAALYDIDLSENLIGAVVDYECIIDFITGNFPNLPYRRYITEKLQLHPLDFFNTGVLSYNITQIKKEKKTPEFTNVFEYAIRLPDQDTLNYVCKGRVKYIDIAWNVQAFSYIKDMFSQLPENEKKILLQARNNAKLIHYTYIMKPWFLPDCELWWSIARRTVFYDTIVREFLEKKNPLTHCLQMQNKLQ